METYRGRRHPFEPDMSPYRGMGSAVQGVEEVLDGVDQAVRVAGCDGEGSGVAAVRGDGDLVPAVRVVAPTQHLRAVHLAAVSHVGGDLTGARVGLVQNCGHCGALALAAGPHGRYQ